MTEHNNHIKFRRIKFNCMFMQPIHSEDEYLFLQEYGTWMEALYLKKIKPLTEKQEEFCKLVEQENPPKEQSANIFWKYLKRKEIAKGGELNNKRKKIKDDREDWKKIRNMRF